MPIKCSNTKILLNFIEQKHPQAEVLHPTDLQTKITFSDGLIMNIYNTGSINFQGNSFENYTASDIVNVIDAINRK